MWHTQTLTALILAIALLAVAPLSAQAPDAGKPPAVSPDMRQGIEQSIDRALAWLALRQQRDGRFEARDEAQPGVTSLCILAFLANGHLPGQGPYGEAIARAIDFTLSTQKSDGLFCLRVPEPELLPYNAGHTANYNHAITGLMLAEAYGMTSPNLAARIRPALEKALPLCYSEQRKPKQDKRELGGWRYYRHKGPAEADVSITSWMLMFLRSARNAGFDIPAKSIDEALEYIKNSFDPQRKNFVYALHPAEDYESRAITGAAIVALTMGGFHDTPIAQAGGDWLLRNDFDQYNRGRFILDRYHYSAFYASQAMFQLGGDYWSQFYPRLAAALVANQGREGNWQEESRHDGLIGNVYTTALCVLSLSAPNQILPIFQR